MKRAPPLAQAAAARPCPCPARRSPRREPRRVRLLEKIGQGGMAEVFAAAWTPSEGAERAVAVKRLRPEL